MGTPMVIGVEMLLECAVDVVKVSRFRGRFSNTVGVDPLQLSRVEVPELAAGGGVSPFDPAVVLGSSRGKEVKGEVGLPAGGLELGHELGSGVDLQRGDGARHLLEAGSGGSGWGGERWRESSRARPGAG